MEAFSHVIRVGLPNYLKALPVPESLGGLFKLSLKELVQLTPLGLLIAGSGYLTYRALTTQGSSGTPKKGAAGKGPSKNKVNETIKKDCPKVVDSFEIEDIGSQKVFCRCWKSNKFPYCDGSHTKHNEETGDNVGPLIVKKSS